MLHKVFVIIFVSILYQMGPNNLHTFKNRGPSNKTWVIASELRIMLTLILIFFKGAQCRATDKSVRHCIEMCGNTALPRSGSITTNALL